jgi:hypothetical protein
MSLRLPEIITTLIARAETEMTGLVASPFYQLAADGGNWMWAVDVDIGEPEVLRNVPVATNNRDLFYAEIGQAVALRRQSDGRWAVVGLAKTSRGLGHIFYVSFEDDMVRVVSEDWTGQLTRRLTFGELGELQPFGTLPWGCYGRFTPGGALSEILEY